MTTSPSPTSPDDTRLRALYGDAALAPPARTPLRAGPLTLLYTDLGDLRTIRLGPHEIVRRLYHAVRAADWATIPAQITVTERTIGTDSFRIAYTARHQDQEKGIDFQAHVTLTGDADGTLTYDFAGEALSTFARNRIGICVLHPAQDCRGLPCRVTHTTGNVEEGAFPDLIAPHQPFFDIAALSHAIGETGATATITFAGDVFEMEDQRNWLDASYKTYSTPLALPMPVTVTPGTRIRQTITLRLSDVPAQIPARDAGPVIVEIGDASPHPLPQIGLTSRESARLGNFTELNRNRPNPANVADFTYAANPMVHAFDSLSIMETPPMIAETLRTAASFAAGKPVRINPLTLYGPRRPNDPRHEALLGAAWHVAAFAYAARGGVAAVTFSPLSDTASPLRHVLQSLGNDRSQAAHLLQTTVSDELAVACVAFTYKGMKAGTSVTLINLTPDAQTVTVRGMDTDTVTVSTLNETNAAQGFSEPFPLPSPDGQTTLTLLPYAIADIMTTL